MARQRRLKEAELQRLEAEFHRKVRCVPFDVAATATQRDTREHETKAALAEAEGRAMQATVRSRRCA